MEWVALTNGVIRRVYRVSFAKPIDQQLVLDLDLLALIPKSREHIDNLYLLMRESITKSGLLAYHDHKEATSRFFLAGVLLGDTVVETIRRELRVNHPTTRRRFPCRFSGPPAHTAPAASPAPPARALHSLPPPAPARA